MPGVHSREQSLWVLGWAGDLLSFRQAPGRRPGPPDCTPPRHSGPWHDLRLLSCASSIIRVVPVCNLSQLLPSMACPAEARRLPQWIRGAGAGVPGAGSSEAGGKDRGHGWVASWFLALVGRPSRGLKGTRGRGMTPEEGSPEARLGTLHSTGRVAMPPCV